MGWFLVAIGLLVLFPKARFILLMLVMGLSIWYLVDTFIVDRDMTSNEYSFEVLTVTPDSGNTDMAYTPKFYIEGQLTNNSTHPIESWVVITDLYDCYAGSCTYLGRHREPMYGTIVPGQTYYFNKPVTLVGMHNLNRGLDPRISIASVVTSRF